jgi:class 3 adenylate cyclase/DNA-binding winged helix-turn-helix (wHTH) protein/tetratricopeptide (TPR) repeat protein
MSSPQWLFGGFRLDPDNACLWRGTQTIALTPKAFAVLHYLVTHPDCLVTKDTLLDAVWPETAISDTVVRIAVGELRRALGDMARAPRFIATIHRRGYRFLAPVTVAGPPEPAPVEEPLRRATTAPSPQEALLSGPDIPAHQEESNTWRCAVCQYPQSRAARFCVACGAPHVESCRVCGQGVPMPATFCPGCGHRLEVLPPTEPAPRLPASLAPPVVVSECVSLAYTPMALVEKIRTSRAAVVGERKHVTVLFADIKDSLELIRGLDPEAAQQLLDPALHAMMDAVHRYEGTVNQVLGDGIMALFGAPIAHEDHALRACYAALAMQAALRAYAEEVCRTHGLTMQSRIGLNSGEVVVRTIHHDLYMEYSAVGQTTYLAARMEQVASPDAIVLSAATVRLVEGLVRVKAWGPVPIKGLTEPVEVWELLGVSGRRRRLQTARARGLTRFVGRQTELALLDAALGQADAGHGQVVAVVGEAGVGKSRLVDEFVQTAYTQGWLVLDSAAVSYGQTTPYFPILDLLRRYCHLEEHDDVRTIQAKVTEQVRTLDVALHDTLSALLALLDALPADSPFLQLDAPQRRQRTLAALKWVLLRQSQRQPVLLVCEDLHWLDTETQALLDSLGEGLPTARLLLLVNYRPDYRHGWGSKTYYTQVRLDPLPPASADTFLQDLVGNDPSLSPLTQLLIQRTEGNPFFLEESVRTLVETGALVGEAGAYRVAPPLPTIQVPATVQAVLAARIDRVPPEEKHLLQTAAVLGTEVLLPLLQAVAELPEAALRLGLAHLQDAEFLYEASLFPELVYTFKHALTQEVAYGSLLQERRRVLHARIVAALETTAGDRLAEQVERLAHHALRGEVWDKALAYCRQAGDKAVARCAYQEATAYYEQALSALPRLPETRNTHEQAIDLWLALRSALYPVGEFRRILVCLQEAQARAEALGDHHRLGWISAQLSVHFGQICAPDHALTTGQRALTIAADLGDVGLTVTARHYLGDVYRSLGDYRRAVAYFQENVACLHSELCYERFGLHGLVSVLSRSFLVASLAECGAFTEGRALAEAGVQIAEAADHPYSRGSAYWGVGFLSLHQGDLHQAMPMLEHALNLAQGAHIWLGIFRSAAPLGAAYALAGRTADALPLLEQAVEQTMAMGFMLDHALRVTWLSEAYLLAGRLDDACTQAQCALEFSQAHQERSHTAYALRLLGEIAAHRDPLESALAEDHYQQALVLANELGMRPLQAHCHRGLGTLYSRVGRLEEARTALSTAIHMYRTMEMSLWLPQAEATLAQIGGRSQR